jgi:hypothetical protein
MSQQQMNQLGLNQQQQPVVSKVFSQSSHLPKASYHGLSADLALKRRVLTELQYTLTFLHIYRHYQYKFLHAQ